MTTNLILGLAASAMALALLGPLAHPFGPVRQAPRAGAPLFSGAEMPDDVRQTFENKCADCHSQRTKWPLYSHVAPVSWLLERDVATGRSHLDASIWPSYDNEQRLDLLAQIARQSRNRSMPPGQYTLIHRNAKLSADEAEHMSSWAKLERRRLQHESSK